MKNLVTLLAVLCLAIYVVGCGTDDTGGPSSNGNVVSPNGNGTDLGNGTDTPTGTLTETPTEASVDTSKETPQEAQNDTPKDASEATPQEKPKDAPNDKPAPPAKPEGGTKEVDKSKTEKKPVDDTKDDVDEEN